MKVAIHTTVRHNRYGKGEVVKITDGNVYVLFGKSQRIFPYPEAFEKGFLLAEIMPEYSTNNPHDTDPAVLTQKDIKHHIMVIKINQRYEENISPDDLYNSVRGIWKASKNRAERVDYAFGVYQSVIVAVYKPTEWYVCREAQDRLPRKDIVLSAKNENRIFFEDKSYEQGLPLDENQQFYIGKSINMLMNKNSQNPITYLDPKDQSSTFVNKDPNREVILDAADNISYKKIYEAINATVGANYSGWMKAGWPDGKPEYPFWIWFPKLAEYRDGKLVSAAFDCVNTISDDWNEVIFEDLKDTPLEIDGNWKTSPVLIFAKEPKGGPYIFRGVYLRDIQKSRYKHHVISRIGTRVKLTGQPSENIEILDDFRK